MSKRFLSIISLAFLTLLSVVTGIFLVSEINTTYASPEFQSTIVSSE